MSLFVEKYDPLVVRVGDSFQYALMSKDKLKLNWGLLMGLSMIPATIAIALTTHPAWFLGTALFLILLGCYSIDAECFPILKRKYAYHFSSKFGISTLATEWYDCEFVKKESIYREKVMEYLDYLRSGGDQSDSVEAHLNTWRLEMEQEKRIAAIRKDHQIAEMFVNTEQLEAYRKAKKEVFQQ